MRQMGPAKCSRMRSAPEDHILTLAQAGRTEDHILTLAQAGRTEDHILTLAQAGQADELERLVAQLTHTTSLPPCVLPRPTAIRRASESYFHMRM